MLPVADMETMGSLIDCSARYSPYLRIRWHLLKAQIRYSERYVLPRCARSNQVQCRFASTLPSMAAWYQKCCGCFGTNRFSTGRWAYRASVAAYWLSHVLDEGFSHDASTKTVLPQSIDFILFMVWGSYGLQNGRKCWRMLADPGAAAAGRHNRPWFAGCPLLPVMPPERTSFRYNLPATGLCVFMCNRWFDPF